MRIWKKNQEWFRETARKIDPKKTPQQILEDAEKNHPAPDKTVYRPFAIPSTGFELT